MNNSNALESFFVGFDVKLFLLVILLSIWVGALFKNKEQSSRFMQVLGELLLGLLGGLALGVLWNMNFHAGIFTVSALTFAIMLLMNTKPNNRLARFCAILVAFAMAMYVYYSYWGGMTYLMDILLEDFQGAI